MKSIFKYMIFLIGLMSVQLQASKVVSRVVVGALGVSSVYGGYSYYQKAKVAYNVRKIEKLKQAEALKAAEIKKAADEAYAKSIRGQTVGTAMSAVRFVNEKPYDVGKVILLTILTVFFAV